MGRQTGAMDDASRRMNAVDVIVSILLLCVHVALAFLMAFVAPFLAMGTDACAYQACGDEQWVVRAMYVAWGGGAVTVLLDPA